VLKQPHTLCPWSHSMETETADRAPGGAEPAVPDLGGSPRQLVPKRGVSGLPLSARRRLAARGAIN
jgi:hypothetical protein